MFRVAGRSFAARAHGPTSLSIGDVTVSYALCFYVFTRILGIAAMIVVMGIIVDRYLIRRHYKRANG